jgi:hypothetical protein
MPGPATTVEAIRHPKHLPSALARAVLFREHLVSLLGVDLVVVKRILALREQAKLADAENG